MNRVAIGIPSRGEMVTDTALCLASLAAHEAAGGRPFRLIAPQGSLVCMLRDEIVLRAQMHEATHILWIDSDMTFPMNGLERLLAHGKPIVGCNYPTRSSPAWPTARGEEGRLVFETGQTGLEEVTGLGLGFCLVEMGVFQQMPRPWFSVVFDEFGQRYVGEDFNFFRNASFPVLLDHDLSREIGHVGIHEFVHADTEETIKNVQGG